MQTPIETFNIHYNSLCNLLKAGDVFALLKLDDIRGSENGYRVAKKVVKDGADGCSSLRHSKSWYLTKEEQAKFGQDGYIKEVCQQIVQLSYAAFESYMVNNFRVLLSKKVTDDDLYAAVLATIRFRSLRCIKNHYKRFLNIELTKFEHKQIGIYEEAWFQPKTVWEGITILSDVRNEIAHEGFCKSYDIVYLVDAHSVIQFIHDWVVFFDIKYGVKKL